MAIDANAENPEMQPPAGCQGCAEESACGAAHPGEWDWYAMWMIEKMDGTHIGDLCFKGLREDGIAEIGYGILEEYQGQGYATEAVQAACRWAFLHPDVRSLEAETDAGNTASQRVLEKCGFRPNGTFGEEGPRFTLGRPIDAGETG